MAFEIIKNESHKAWEEMRKTGLGSSEIATVAGQNPYMSKYELWKIKLGLEDPIQENEDMTQGHELEDAVARMFNRHTGLEIISSSRGDWQFRNKEKTWMLASPDRTYWRSEKHDPKDWKNCKGILECKTTRRRDITADNIPAYWFCQVQWQLGIGEMEEAHIAWLNKWGCEFGFARIDFAPEVFKMLVEMGEEFWCKNILERIEPVEYSAKDVKNLFKKEVAGKVANASEEIITLSNLYNQKNDALKALTEEVEEMKDKFIVAIGDAEKLVAPDGRVLATFKAPKPSQKFDAKRYQADHPEEAQEYIYMQENARRLSIK